MRKNAYSRTASYADTDLAEGAHSVTDADSNVINWAVTDDLVSLGTKTIIVSVTTGRDTTTIAYVKSDL